MPYNDGRYYTWERTSDYENTYYTKGKDGTEIRRNKRFEMLHFRNHLAEILFSKFPDTVTFQEKERMIKEDVPVYIKLI